MAILDVIDAGHGGPDPGNVNFGLEEEDVTLPTALFMEIALKRQGINVIQTRRTDVQPAGGNVPIGQDLHFRAELANNNHAAAFISFHTDSTSNPQAAGVATWVHPNAGARTVQLAQGIVNAISAATGLENRGVRRADYQVLRDTTMPAVLIEMAFSSNPVENEKLRHPEFQQAQAEAAARATAEWHGIKWVPAPIAVPSVPAPKPAPSAAPGPLIGSPDEPVTLTPDWAKGALEKLTSNGLLNDTTGTNTFFRTVVLMDRLGLLPEVKK